MARTACRGAEYRVALSFDCPDVLLGCANCYLVVVSSTTKMLQAIC